MFMFFSFVVSDNGEELQLLLSFKSSIHDPSGFLSNRDSSATFFPPHFRLPFTNLTLSNNQLYGEIPRIFFRHLLRRFGFLNSVTITSQVKYERLHFRPRGIGSFKHMFPGKSLLKSDRLRSKVSRSRSGRLFKLILFKFASRFYPKGFEHLHHFVASKASNNRLSGELSSEFTKLPLVYFLDVSNDYLSGNFGDQKWDMPSLEMLSLAGKLPRSSAAKD
ncbi:hypothetical protein F3Y22_tig00010505pilonHSYRG00001 [Hibiscus syriacus]|uniref:Uncharacterized protein n=1 Tax=Hibiscus syriacus TaxID=106335 RepID=A0A6A3CBC4_HIBSY|nr:hypothetical protein F3Y22_tig00010505pilonHSYRG00001 [Hibiscus syriacus]